MQLDARIPPIELDDAAPPSFETGLNGEIKADLQKLAYEETQLGGRASSMLWSVELWIGLSVLFSVVGFPIGAKAEPVAVTVSPFIWAPALKGTLVEGPVTIPLDAGVEDLAGGIKGGAMLHAEARSDRWQGSVQTIYVDFHDQNFAPIMGADVRSSLLTVEALAGPRFSAGNVEFVPLAGLRHTRIRGTFETPALGRLQAGRAWQEGLAGLEVGIPVSRRLSLRARGTVAVIGPSRHRGSDLIAVTRYRLGRSVSLAAGYRWASERIVPGPLKSFGMNLNAKGPLLGLSFDL